MTSAQQQVTSMEAGAAVSLAASKAPPEERAAFYAYLVGAVTVIDPAAIIRAIGEWDKRQAERGLPHA